MIKIKTDLGKKGYKYLMQSARDNVLSHTSYRYIKMTIKGETDKIIGCIKCEGVVLNNFSYRFNGIKSPLKIKYGFEIIMKTQDLDLIKKILDSDDVIIDNKEYYFGDYTPGDIMSTIKFVSYNLESKVE